MNCAPHLPLGQRPFPPCAPLPKALPLARRAFPFIHYDSGSSHADENLTIHRLVKPQFDEWGRIYINSRRYMNCAPHLPLGRRPFPLRHFAVRRYPSPAGRSPSAALIQTVVMPMRIQPSNSPTNRNSPSLTGSHRCGKMTPTEQGWFEARWIQQNQRFAVLAWRFLFF